MEYINTQVMLIISNMTKFQKEYYQMDSFNYVTDYINEIFINKEYSFPPSVCICLFMLLSFVIVNILYLLTITKKYNTKSLDYSYKILEEFIEGVSCVKVPKVFTLVSKEYFETDTNMYLTFAGKLSLGRHLAKNVVRVDNTKNYLTQKDPITKKEFRFLCYTPGDIENMKTETRNWIIDNKVNWFRYFAY